MHACVVFELPEDEVELHEVLEYYADPDPKNADKEKAMLLRHIAVVRNKIKLNELNPLFYYTKDLMK